MELRVVVPLRCRLHRARGDPHCLQFGEERALLSGSGPGLDGGVEAFAMREAVGALSLDALWAAHPQGELLATPKLLEFWLPGHRWLRSRGRAPSVIATVMRTAGQGRVNSGGRAAFERAVLPSD